MASLEQEFKQTAGLSGKLKLTLAEMITGMTQRPAETGPKAKGQVRVSNGGCQA
jgi:hypothetical protein